MRTSIYLPDDLLIEAKRLAVESRCTLTSIIEQALREKVTPRAQKETSRIVRLITYGKGGTLSGVDLNDTSALMDVMENDHVPDGR